MSVANEAIVGHAPHGAIHGAAYRRAHGAVHGSRKSYAIGFLLAIALTLVPFGLVMSHASVGTPLIIAVFALAQIGRLTGDRERDLPADVRERVARRLSVEPGGERLVRLIREIVPLEAREEARLLDESLPAGLRLRA